jgi:hypothetical protein
MQGKDFSSRPMITHQDIPWLVCSLNLRHWYALWLRGICVILRPFLSLHFILGRKRKGPSTPLNTSFCIKQNFQTWYVLLGRPEPVIGVHVADTVFIAVCQYGFMLRFSLLQKAAKEQDKVHSFYFVVVYKRFRVPFRSLKVPSYIKRAPSCSFCPSLACLASDVCRLSTR